MNVGISAVVQTDYTMQEFGQVFQAKIRRGMYPSKHPSHRMPCASHMKDSNDSLALGTAEGS